MGITSPSNATLLSTYRQLLNNGKIKANQVLEQALVKGPIRTLSGVSVITVLTKPWPCPGHCLYCPAEPAMPKSYLSNEPAAQRAVRLQFDPYRQVQQRIRALEANGHPVDKIEILVLGGSWSNYPNSYQTWFIGKVFQASNTYGQPRRRYQGLKKEQKINETTKYKIIGLTLETRPDLITEKEIKKMRQLGCTRVQLGVQHTDDKILKLIRRGHDNAASIQATKLLKTTGFKVDHHYMPDLPGSTPARDLKMFQQVFTSGELMPDQIKIYPCVVNQYAPLYHWLRDGRHRPYSEKQLIELLIKIKSITPPWVRINRLVRDIPRESIIAGNQITNLRQYVQTEMAKRGLTCHCLRCREAREQTKKLGRAKLFTRTYAASHGQEYFLSYESPDQKTIYAFLRLRFNNSNEKNIFPKLQAAALVRELHVYGQMTPVREINKDSYYAQHQGLGKKLMAAAEKLARQNGQKKIAVIAGVGVRNYYRKLGYKLVDTYMIKAI